MHQRPSRMSRNALENVMRGYGIGRLNHLLTTLSAAISMLNRVVQKCIAKIFLMLDANDP